MGKLFNRPAPAHVDQAIAAYLSALSGDDSAQAIANNLRRDHRVSPMREAQWLNNHPVASGADVPNALKLYCATVTWGNPNDTFLHDANAPNAVFGWPGAPNRIKPKAELITSFDLTKLHALICDRFGLFGGTHFATYPRSIIDPDSGNAVSDWHAQQISDTSGRFHLTKVLDAMREFVEVGHSRHPVWVSRYDAVRPFIRQSRPDQWIARVGLEQYFQPGHWIALLKYPVNYTGTLLRPTTLDAGTYPWHAPSPPDATLGTGGHPVNLGPDTCALIPEFIHEQVPSLLHIDFWIDGWLGRTATSAPRDVHGIRNRHENTLLAQYPGTTADWLAAT